MPRYRRLFVPNFPLHIVQRGHDRKPVFDEDGDYAYYLSNLAEAKSELGIRLTAYCLMTNHVHLILIPGEDTGNISRLMRVLAGKHTRRINKLDHRTGTLWEGRFKASLIDTQQYLLACCRYVDLNPVRAGMVASPADYKWSGYRGRTGNATDTLLDGHPVFDALSDEPKKRGPAYREYVAQAVSDDEVSLIRQALDRNQLTGNDRFRAEIEARVGQRISSLPPGRPKKQRHQKASIK